MRSTRASRGWVRWAPRSRASSRPIHPQPAHSRSVHPLIAGLLDAVFLPTGSLPARLCQPGHTNCESRFHHFKLAPRQPYVTGAQRHVVCLSPLRLDHLPGREREQITNPKLPHRKHYIHLHRQPRKQRTQSQWLVPFKSWRSRNQSLPGHRLCRFTRRRCAARRFRPGRWQWLHGRHVPRSPAEK